MHWEKHGTGGESCPWPVCSGLEAYDIEWQPCTYDLRLAKMVHPGTKQRTLIDVIPPDLRIWGRSRTAHRLRFKAAQDSTAQEYSSNVIRNVKEIPLFRVTWRVHDVSWDIPEMSPDKTSKIIRNVSRILQHSKSGWKCIKCRGPLWVMLSEMYREYCSILSYGNVGERWVMARNWLMNFTSNFTEQSWKSSRDIMWNQKIKPWYKLGTWNSHLAISVYV